MAEAFEDESEVVEIVAVLQHIEPLTTIVSDIVRLNVGGEKFTTSRSTLCQIEGTLLATMFSGNYEDCHKDSEGFILLDFNPKFFALVLDYLRARLIATPEKPAYLPEVDPRDVVAFKNFNSFVHYLDLADEFQLGAQKYVSDPFGAHSHYISLNDDRTFATSTQGFHKGYYQGFALSESSYNEGVLCWQLAISHTKNDNIFVGVLEDNPTLYNSLVLQDRESEHKRHWTPPLYVGCGSFGWKLVKDLGHPVINSRQSVTAVSTGRKSDFGCELVELMLDCQRKTLALILVNGEKFRIALPNMEARWKLQIGLCGESTHVEICKP